MEDAANVWEGVRGPGKFQNSDIPCNLLGRRLTSSCLPAILILFTTLVIMLGCIKLLLVAALVVSCLAAGNSTPKTSKPQPQKPAKSNSHGKAVAFALRQTANEPEVPAVRFLLAGCGPQYNTLSAKQRNIFDKTLHNAVVKFQMAQKMKPADGTKRIPVLLGLCLGLFTQNRTL